MWRNSKEQREKQFVERLNEETLNNQGYIMKIIQYITSHDIVVEFQDKYKKCVHTTYRNFLNGKVRNPAERLGNKNKNHQGCMMKIIVYNNANDIVVEFQDKYKATAHTNYKCFLSGKIKNPYYPSVLGIGIIGKKYPVTVDSKMTKEYQTWVSMLKRCFDLRYKEKYSTYKNVICCNEWLLYENFYEWLHSQINFDQWLNGKRWCLDKDILINDNKIYAPDTCCLVPECINLLFTSQRQSKKELIEQVAEVEFAKGNITKQCYNSMINYRT